MNDKIKKQAINILQNISDEICQNEMTYPEYNDLLPILKQTIKNITEEKLCHLIMDFLNFGLDYVEHSHATYEWSKQLFPLASDYIKIKMTDLIKERTSHDI